MEMLEQFGNQLHLAENEEDVVEQLGFALVLMLSAALLEVIDLSLSLCSLSLRSTVVVVSNILRLRFLNYVVKQITRFFASLPEESRTTFLQDIKSLQESKSFDEPDEVLGLVAETYLSPDSRQKFKPVFEKDDEVDAKKVKTYDKHMKSIVSAVGVAQNALDNAITELQESVLTPRSPFESASQIYFPSAKSGEYPLSIKRLGPGTPENKSRNNYE